MTEVFSHVLRGLIALRQRGILALVALMLALTPWKAHGQAATKEYQLKAVFIFNFAQFVDWPTNSFTDSNAPFRIGVLGDNPFGSALDETVNGEKIHGRKIVIVHAARAESLSGCQIVFVAHSERNHISDFLAAIAGHPILTVGETDDFAQHGGIINFYLDANKVRFEINPTAARARGLEISSQLLGVGKIIGGDPTVPKR